ncbi:hypothetical protein HY212_02940 [Candidatus Pacearchaeota archaeon]|nr:hypothetical protein [Candidatus Pacearchaeota archaeon]
MDKFTAVVPCYDGVEKHNLATRLSYALFYGTQYLPMKTKVFYNLSSHSVERMVTDINIGRFERFIPLFGPVVSALRDSKKIGEIVLFGNRYDLERSIEFAGLEHLGLRVLDKNATIGVNLFSSADGNYSLQEHVFLCLPDVPLITGDDVDRLLSVYASQGDLDYHDIIAGFVPMDLYLKKSEVKKKFIRLKTGDYSIPEEVSRDLFGRVGFKESCGFLIRIGAFSPELIDIIYKTRKMYDIPAQISSVINNPNRTLRLRMLRNHIARRSSINSMQDFLSEYFEARVKLVLHDVLNFSIDGDSLEDIVKLAKSFT